MPLPPVPPRSPSRATPAPGPRSRSLPAKRCALLVLVLATTACQVHTRYLVPQATLAQLQQLAPEQRAKLAVSAERDDRRRPVRVAVRDLLLDAARPTADGRAAVPVGPTNRQFPFGVALLTIGVGCIGGGFGVVGDEYARPSGPFQGLATVFIGLPLILFGAGHTVAGAVLVARHSPPELRPTDRRWIQLPSGPAMRLGGSRSRIYLTGRGLAF